MTPGRIQLPLRRHRLVRLHADAWHELLLRRHGDAPARECLRHWQSRDLPLVVARQPAATKYPLAAQSDVLLGLAMPNRWGRGRLSLTVRADAIREWRDFPAARDAASLMPSGAGGLWRALCRVLLAASCDPMVYGAYGWELFTGLAYLRHGSDVDLLMPVRSAEQADYCVALLAEAARSDDFTKEGPRIDGELLFADGAAVAWREWAAWRSGQAAAVLVKRIDTVEMVSAPWWLARHDLPEAPAHAS